MTNWESLIAARMRPCSTICREEDPGKRNALNVQRRWAKEHPDKIREAQRKQSEKRKHDPKRKEWQKAYDATPERKAKKRAYREANRDEINRKKREYRATEKGKRKTIEYNAIYRERNRERERERKRLWWRRTHPNPGPIGRPRKQQEEDNVQG